jgi:hypothetical protein
MVLSAWIGACSLFARTKMALVRRWAIVPTMVTLLILGIPSSSGAVARPLLPAFDRVIGSWLPDGAMVAVLRTLTYFPQHQHLEPMLVLAAWTLGLLGVFLVVANLRASRARLRESAPAAGAPPAPASAAMSG